MSKKIVLGSAYFSGLILAAKVLRITPEIVEVDCPECGGDGDWTKFMPHEDELEPKSIPCIRCKGTGRVYA